MEAIRVTSTREKWPKYSFTSLEKSAEISATIKDLKNAGVIDPTISLYLANAEDRWIMENDSWLSKLQSSNPIVAAVPLVVALPEQINTSPGRWYAAIDLANAFFSIPIH